MQKTFLCLAAALILAGCSGDESNGGASGDITINGDASPLKHGYIVSPSDGSDPNLDPRRFLILLTDGEINDQAGELSLSPNTHRLISLNLNTDIAHPGSVQNATYPIWTPMNVPDTDGPFTEAFVDDDIVVEDGDLASSVEYSSDTMEAGHVTIVKNGDTYDITFTMHNGDDSIDATFHGSLSEISMD